jgi:hypothetical protein
MCDLALGLDLWPLGFGLCAWITLPAHVELGTELGILTAQGPFAQRCGNCNILPKGGAQQKVPDSIIHKVKQAPGPPPTPQL